MGHLLFECGHFEKERLGFKKGMLSKHRIWTDMGHLLFECRHFEKERLGFKKGMLSKHRIWTTKNKLITHYTKEFILLMKK